MSYSDLLDRMKGNDTEAFLEMTDRYGWSVYSAIREKHSDHAMADKIYNDTMNAFYRTLSTSPAEDPLEALLCAFVEHISVEKSGAERVVPVVNKVPPKIQLDPFEQTVMDSGTTVRKKRGFWYHVGVLLTLAAITVVVWGIIGLLMDMNFIPYYDLGYSWFNTNVVHFF